jgi:hypothetical protein
VDTTTTRPEPRSNLLADYLTEQQLAVELARNPRTLQRWRKLGIGPPVTMIGELPYYNIEKAQAWLADGGTAGAPKKKFGKRSRRGGTGTRPKLGFMKNPTAR